VLLQGPIDLVDEQLKCKPFGHAAVFSIIWEKMEDDYIYS
jgi:hypothetical protein